MMDKLGAVLQRKLAAHFFTRRLVDMDSIGVMTLAAGLLAIGVGIIVFFNQEYAWGVLLFVVGWITIGVVISHFTNKKKGR